MWPCVPSERRLEFLWRRWWRFGSVEAFSHPCEAKPIGNSLRIYPIRAWKGVGGEIIAAAAGNAVTLMVGHGVGGSTLTSKRLHGGIKT